MKNSHGKRRETFIAKNKGKRKEKKKNKKMQWLRLSWQSGCFPHQRSAVQIPTWAKFYLPIARLAELKLRRQEMARLIKKNEKRKKEI